MTKKIFSYFFVLTCLSLKSQVSTSGCYLSGGMTNGKTAGCGNSPTPCNLAATSYSYFGAFCGSTVTTGAGSQVQVTSAFILPAGCTATVEAEMKPRTNIHATGCNNSGADGSDFVAITSSGGVIASEGATVCCTAGACGFSLPATSTSASGFTTGCSNSTMISKMVVTGGTVTLIGKSDRADEITTYTITMSGTCGANCSDVLPIQLSEFSGKVHDGYIELHWSVAKEDNVEYYSLEKSSDGKNFDRFAEIASIAGKAGSENLNYMVTDDFPFRAINYYRLESHDKSGNSEIYPVIAVYYSFKSRSEIQVAYTNDEVLVLLDGAAKNRNILITDLTGRLLNRLESDGTNVFKLPAGEFPKGLYSVSVEGVYLPAQKLIVH